MNVFTDFATESADTLGLRVARLQVLLDVRPAVGGAVRAPRTAEHLAACLVKPLKDATLQIL